MSEAHNLLAVSPIDGRYADKTQELQEITSEYGLINYRLQIIAGWYDVMISGVLPDVAAVSDEARAELAEITSSFNVEDAKEIKAIEKTTNHDVKAVELWLKQQIEANDELHKHQELIHFGCTSEDVNNMAYALMLSEMRKQVLGPRTDAIVEDLDAKAKDWADIPLLSLTHGQPATPTTLGKEVQVFATRLRDHAERMGGLAIRGKWNGATGNYAAASFAYPEVDWATVSAEFVRSFGFEPTIATTQIEPHDWMVTYFNEMAHGNAIKLDLVRDVWGYVQRGVFGQKAVKGETGSSTMPHKVNPIDFENAEANLGYANAGLNHLAGKLPVSRFQRDLSDSSALRTVGEIAGHTLIADKSVMRGLGKIVVNLERTADELAGNWAVLTEAVQTVLRRHRVVGAYEIVKQASRGEQFGEQEYHDLVSQLDIPETDKKRLMDLTPAGYVGRSGHIARRKLKAN